MARSKMRIAKRNKAALAAKKRRKMIKVAAEVARRRRQSEEARNVNKTMTPEQILTGFVEQTMTRGSNLNHIKLLIRKRKEEMQAKYNEDRIKYAKMPFATWDQVDKLATEAIALNNVLMELTGAIEDCSTMAEKMNTFAKAFAKSSDAQLAHATLIDAIHKSNDAYMKFIENPEEDLEELDLPDTVFEVSKDNEDLQQIKADTEAHKSFANTLGELSTAMAELEEASNTDPNELVDAVETTEETTAEVQPVSESTTDKPEVTPTEQLAAVAEEIQLTDTTPEVEDTPAPVEKEVTPEPTPAETEPQVETKTEEAPAEPVTIPEIKIETPQATSEDKKNSEEEFNKFLHN